MAFLGPAAHLFLPFPRAPVLVARGEWRWSLLPGSPAVSGSSGEFAVGSRRWSLPANQGHKCQPGAEWASCCWFVPLGFVSRSSAVTGRDNRRRVLGNRI